jgi:hypothetical protein
MNQEIPFGQTENERREFKGREALKHLSNISREVVGMLNASGGEIWVGIAEEQGRATRLEAIENAMREVHRLRDHFCDAIEPSPIVNEITVERVPIRDKQDLLKIRVKPVKGRAPYALREGTARHFVKRVYDRLRPMSREEIFHVQPDGPHEIALNKTLAARRRYQQTERLWLRIQPVGEADLRLSPDFREYFTNALRTGNRLTGWNFVNPDTEFKPTPGEVRHGREGETCVRVFRDGAIELTMPIINLYWKTSGGPGQTDVNEIWPYVLLEYPASVFRLAGKIYLEGGVQVDAVLADLALFGIHDWTLRPDSPVSFSYKAAEPKGFEGKEIVSAEPLSFSLEEVINEPDRCAFRLVRRVYEAFGLFEEQMPAEFDRDSGKLILPGS